MLPLQALIDFGCLIYNHVAYVVRTAVYTVFVLIEIEGHTEAILDRLLSREQVEAIQVLASYPDMHGDFHS